MSERADPHRLPWARRAPALLVAMLALAGHLLQALHFAAHVHVYCAVHDRMEHAGSHQATACCHGHGDEHGDPGATDSEGTADSESGGDASDGGDGEHESCGMQPPGKLADPPSLSFGVLSAPALGTAALAPRAQERHGLEPLVFAPKHSPPLA